MTVSVVAFDSAERFVQHLRPSDSRWWNEDTGRRSHLFRGHANATWSLLPKGWRPLHDNPAFAALMDRIQARVVIPATSTRRSENGADIWRLSLAEAAIQFAALGREIGLEIPWEVPPSVFDRPPSHIPHINPALLALAQHHGVPTQLLDWSYDPLTAAYFAATGAYSEDDLCVWALDITKIEPGERNVPMLTLSPTAGNPNLRAQSGCFLAYDQGPDINTLFQFHGGRWPPFENSANLRCALQKFVLVGRERRELVALLLREGRSRAHLMPSWDSVASTVIDSWTNTS